MKLETLRIQNFRTYSEAKLNFSSRLIFFIGENGEGKTNLLEAISLFSNLKSFRENTDDELVKWNENFFYLDCIIKNSDGVKRLEIGFTNQETKKKKFKVNETDVKNKSDFIGEFKTVIFTPNDLKIVEGGPAERRKFVDYLLSVSDNYYLNDLLEYNRALKHRNVLLKNKFSSRKEFLPWNEILSVRGQRIINKRKEFIENLKTIFSENLKNLSGGKDEFEIRYIQRVSNPDTYTQALDSSFEIDLRVGHTTVGIHRDEIFIGKDNKDIESFASQGQKRSVAISLRTSQFYYVQKITGETPILLIDDVIRELDIKRREYFVDLILNSGQAFFTTTDLEGIKDYIGSLDEKIEVYKVSNGFIEKYESS
ncbi:MAG: DNA replication/repair protein RecF [Leptospiraceae bacterium]|nr:DNA replication/repair protein RecF [Leptospiraceae bacterium]